MASEMRFCSAEARTFACSTSAGFTGGGSLIGKIQRWARERRAAREDVSCRCAWVVIESPLFRAPLCAFAAPCCFHRTYRTCGAFDADAHLRIAWFGCRIRSVSGVL